MIVTCPSCQSKYSVQTEAIGNGKLVRCMICGNVWQQSGVSKNKQGVSRGLKIIEWTFFWFVVFFSGFLLIFAPQNIVNIWPPAACFYAIFNINAANKNDKINERNAIKICNVSKFFVYKHDKLYVGLKGEIKNFSNETLILPDITISLKNDSKSIANGKGHFKKIWTHDMTYKKILGGQKLPFETEMQSVPNNDLECEIKLDAL